VNCLGSHDDPTEAESGYLCRKCFGRLRRALRDLPAVATWLEVNIAAGGAAGERVSGTREDPIPLRVDILDLIGPVNPDPSHPPGAKRLADNTLDAAAVDQLGDPSFFDELRSWAALVEEETEAGWADRRTLSGAATFLLTHLHWVSLQPWVDEFNDAVHKLHRRAHRVVPWREEVRRDPQPCDRCGVRAIVMHMTQGRSVCEERAGGCGRIMVWDHQRKDAAC
jgi:hypothetical protein